MKTPLSTLAALLALAVLLSACQGDPPYGDGDEEKYRRNHDRYMDSYEPKTHSPDL
jgi:hypothetical protein